MIETKAVTVLQLVTVKVCLTDQTVLYLYIYIDVFKGYVCYIFASFFFKCK